MTLKIQRSIVEESVVFRLTGHIQAEHVPDLLIALGFESPDSNLLLDLRNVKTVDQDGARFLAQIEAAGTGLRNCSRYTREWITREKDTIPVVGKRTDALNS